MSAPANKFHYLDEEGNSTSPENANRITLIVYDSDKKISKRVDWKRDEPNACEDNTLQLEENEIAFTRTDAILNMKIVIARLMDEFRKATAHNSRGTNRRTNIVPKTFFNPGTHRDPRIHPESSSSYKIQELAKLLISANEKLDDMVWRIFSEQHSDHHDGENCNHG